MIIDILLKGILEFFVNNAFIFFLFWGIYLGLKKDNTIDLNLFNSFNMLKSKKGIHNYLNFINKKYKKMLIIFLFINVILGLFLAYSVVWPDRIYSLIEYILYEALCFGVNGITFLISLLTSKFMYILVEITNKKAKEMRDNPLDGIINYRRINYDDLNLYNILKIKLIEEISKSSFELNNLKILRSKIKVKLERKNESFNLAKEGVWVCTISLSATVILAVVSGFKSNLFLIILILFSLVATAFLFWQDKKLNPTNKEEFIYNLMLEVLDDIENDINNSSKLKNKTLKIFNKIF